MAPKRNFRLRFFVEQGDTLSIQDALGAVQRHLSRLNLTSYVFTMASLNVRARHVTVTVGTSDPNVAAVVRRTIPQDYPDENL